MQSQEITFNRLKTLFHETTSKNRKKTPSKSNFVKINLNKNNSVFGVSSEDNSYNGGNKSKYICLAQKRYRGLG